jgi:hypothetical protein
VVLDTATYTNIFYDFDVDFSAATSIANGDIIFNWSEVNSDIANRTVANYADVTNNYRHAVNQNSGGAGSVVATNDYIIGDTTVSETDTDSAVNHLVYNMGNPPTTFGAYTNPTSSVAGSNIYTAHGYNINQGTWTVDAGDIIYDGIGSYRRINTVTINDFASANTLHYNTSINSSSKISNLVDSGEDFSSVTVGDLVENTDVANSYAEVTQIISPTELVLSDPIFSIGH